MVNARRDTAPCMKVGGATAPAAPPVPAPLYKASKKSRCTAVRLKHIYL